MSSLFRFSRAWLPLAAAMALASGCPSAGDKGSLGGSWSKTGPLATARAYATATLLCQPGASCPTAKLLVVGGYDYPTYLASAELYDPASGTFAATGSLQTARFSHATALLADGRVLVVGGNGSGGTSILASAELYDPASGTFAATGSLATPRQGPTATLLPDGKVLVVGGIGPSAILASAELYDPATGSFGATGPLQTPRAGHSATLLSTGKVLVVGGYDAAGLLASAELYDPATGSFGATGSLAVARASHTATLLTSGELLVAGGGDESNANFLGSAELYDPTSGSFGATGSLTTPREYATATLLPSGKVLVAGGINDAASNPNSTPYQDPDGDGSSGRLPGSLSSSELYDPVAKSFSPTGSLQTPRALQAAALLPDGKVLVAGGRNSANNTLASAELYTE